MEKAVNKVDKSITLIKKDGTKIYPYIKEQKETGRYGFALSTKDNKDRHGGGVYTTDIEDVLRHLLKGGAVRAKSDKPGAQGNSVKLFDRAIVKYEVSEELFPLIESFEGDIQFPQNYLRNSDKKGTEINGLKYSDINSSTQAVFDEVIWRQIQTRRGQSAFRKDLMNVFQNQCCVTGSKVESVLEAAHIIPHAEEANYSIANGLLLRSDIHTLFDLHLVSISPVGVFWISDALKGSEYSEYHGRSIFEVDSLLLKNNLAGHFDVFKKQ